MQITSINLFSAPRNIQNRIRTNNYKINVPFKSDSFEKNSSNDEIKFNSLHERLSNVFQTTDRIKNNPNLTTIEYLKMMEEQHEKLEKLLVEYDKISNLLEKSTPEEYKKDSNIICDFLNRYNELPKNKGFERIGGYEDIKELLKNEFILKSIMMSQTSQNTEVPNSILFYGPPGCGKSTFALALAEQTLSNIEVLDAMDFDSEEDAIIKIEEIAKESKINYTKNNKQRTIILVNEADDLISKNSPALENIKEFIKNCSTKYKCTLFLTTNRPSDIDEVLLENNITPFKVGIGPADKQTCKAIIEQILKREGKYPKDGVAPILSELFKNQKEIYSNANIERILLMTLGKVSNPTTQNFVNTIKSQEEMASITPAILNQFIEDKVKLSNN